MADYDDLIVGQTVSVPTHINPWQALRRLTVGSTLLNDLADGANIGIVAGTYTGNGSATQAVTGVGFQPRFLLVWIQNAAGGGSTYSQVALKSEDDASGFSTVIRENLVTAGFSPVRAADHIISLDSDGFTVGDGTGTSNQLNVNASNYGYVAFR